jgi:RNA polymerase primary sigma factor
MYLTQMGEIPLLTRDQEIGLAKRSRTPGTGFRARSWSATTRSAWSSTSQEGHPTRAARSTGTVKAAVPRNLEKDQSRPNAAQPETLEFLGLDDRDFPELRPGRAATSRPPGAAPGVEEPPRKAVPWSRRLSIRTQKVQPA